MTGRAGRLRRGQGSELLLPQTRTLPDPWSRNSTDSVRLPPSPYLLLQHPPSSPAPPVPPDPAPQGSVSRNGSRFFPPPTFVSRSHSSSPSPTPRPFFWPRLYTRPQPGHRTQDSRRPRTVKSKQFCSRAQVGYWSVGAAPRALDPPLLSDHAPSAYLTPEAGPLLGSLTRGRSHAP